MSTKQAPRSRSPKSRRKAAAKARTAAENLPVIHPHAAGIDVGSLQHYVCVPEDAVPAGADNVRTYGAFTGELDRLVEWLQQCGVKTVAMESTGVFWIPLAQKLEAAHIEVVLVNARYLRYVPGRKSDMRDCQWLQRLHSYGLLSGSFRPTQDICCVRSLMRHRENLTQLAGQAVQHMQQALNYMNIHLHHAVSDLDGETGLRIVDAIIAGERDALKLAALRDPKCSKSTPEELAEALKGDWREEHLFVLGQARQTYQHAREQIQACDQQVEKALAAVVIPKPAEPAEPVPKNPVAKAPEQGRKKKRFRVTKGGLQRDLTEELKRLCGVDLTQIIGLNVLGILIILSEIGLDMSRWHSAKAFCAWLGLCPGNKISGGKVLSSRTAHVVNRVAILLRTVAPSIGRTDTWLGIFHRRMRARLGPAGANTATARKLAALVYHLLKYKEEVIDVDHLLLLERIKVSRIRRLRKQAEELGMEVIEKQKAA